MGRPIMIVLAIIFGMALLAVLYIIFRHPLEQLGYDITSTSRNIMNKTNGDINGQTVISPFIKSVKWLTE